MKIVIIMSSPAIYTLTFIDRAALSYFKNNEPVEWSYRGFLEKMKLFILEDETDDADLPATWRHRFFRVIKLIMNNDNGEKNRIIDQIGTRLLDQVCFSLLLWLYYAQLGGGAPPPCKRVLYEGVQCLHKVPEYGVRLAHCTTQRGCASVLANIHKGCASYDFWGSNSATKQNCQWKLCNVK